MPSDKLSQSPIPPGNRQYFLEPAVAAHYDQSVTENPVAEFDQVLWTQKLHELQARQERAVIVDFGCGTGRSMVPALRCGFHVLGIDLSLPMLAQADVKLGEQMPNDSCLKNFALVRADLLSLPWLLSDSVDLAVCLFSTLGMIRGQKYRRRFLIEVLRVLKPGASFLVHAHNVWHQASFPGGKRWLCGNVLKSFFVSNVEFGDRYADQKHVASFFLHHFTLNSLHRELQQSGLLVHETHPIPDGNHGRQPLGWVCECGKPLNNC